MVRTWNPAVTFQDIKKVNYEGQKLICCYVKEQ